MREVMVERTVLLEHEDHMIDRADVSRTASRAGGRRRRCSSAIQAGTSGDTGDQDRKSSKIDDTAGRGAVWFLYHKSFPFPFWKQQLPSGLLSGSSHGKSSASTSRQTFAAERASVRLFVRAGGAVGFAIAYLLPIARGIATTVCLSGVPIDWANGAKRMALVAFTAWPVSAGS